VYNGLDCCLTAEILSVLQPQLDNLTSRTYAFSKSLQGPVLEMRLRGVLVDRTRRREVVSLLHEKLEALEENLNKIVNEGVGFYGFNWRSPDHLRKLFYDRLGIPPIRKRGVVTTDRAALEKMEQYLVARPIISHLKAMRDLGKKISVLTTEIDPDGRIRTSYNIGGTETGRFSSSISEFGSGGNLQNVEESLRSVLVADAGMKMGYFDAEQGESRVVGGIEWGLFKDSRYLDACESGDLHTTVSKLCRPDMAWSGDLKEDKELAEQPYYRHYSLRKLCKSIGHGTNYSGKPQTLHNLYKIDVDAIEEFQLRYFRAFPSHLKWHAHVERILIETGTIISLLGRKRQFWGRRNDADTLREAIAYDPQGSLADIVNGGMLQLWRANICQLLMQVHDAVVVQYPEEVEDEIVPQILELLRYPVHIGNGRELIIPYGAKTGWNFGEYCCGDRSRKGCEQCKKATNLEGLKTYHPGDKRKRPK